MRGRTCGDRELRRITRCGCQSGRSPMSLVRLAGPDQVSSSRRMKRSHPYPPSINLPRTIHMSKGRNSVVIPAVFSSTGGAEPWRAKRTLITGRGDRPPLGCWPCTLDLVDQWINECALVQGLAPARSHGYMPPNACVTATGRRAPSCLRLQMGYPVPPARPTPPPGSSRSGTRADEFAWSSK